MQPPSDAIAYLHDSIEVAASPTRIYELVSRLERMGEWSLEALGGEWLDGGAGKVGDRFAGHNKSGDRDWTRECEVAKADIGHDFTFVAGGVEANRTWWSYEMAASTNGTTLTERWWIVNKPPAIEALSDEQFAGRVEFTKTMLANTLVRLKASAESGTE